MQKYRFSNPASVVEVSLNPIAKPEGQFRVFDCLCRGFGQNNKAPRQNYAIRAVTPFQAAQLAICEYRKDYGTGNK